jgi:ribose transport system permease protein
VSSAAAEALGTGRGPATPRAAFVRRLFGVPTIFYVLALVMILDQVADPSFLTPSVFLAFLKRATPLMLLAGGQLFVLVSGEFDLSVGALITVLSVAAAELISGDPEKTWWVMGVMLVLAVVVGIGNGVITNRLRVPSFITTLGMMLVLNGAFYYWTNGAPRGSLAENFRLFGRGNLDLPGLGQLPWAVIVLVVLGTGGYLLMHHTTFGHRLFAVGGNPRAAALSGVDVSSTRTLAFVISGLSAFAAGVLLAGFVGVSARTGLGYEFRAISADVLGGAVLGGGGGSLPTAMAGALTLEALFTLLNLLGFPQSIRDAAQGLIIIGAAGFAVYSSRRSG